MCRKLGATCQLGVHLVELARYNGIDFVDSTRNDGAKVYVLVMAYGIRGFSANGKKRRMENEKKCSKRNDHKLQ